MTKERAGPQADCNPHPDAPHGYDRQASISEDRYVCQCEGWTAAPPASAPPDTDVCRPATLLEELRVEEALVPNRRGKLYGLAADEIERLTASAPEPVFYADSEQMVDWQRGVRHGGAIDLRITSSQHPGTCDVPLYLATAHGERQDYESAVAAGDIRDDSLSDRIISYRRGYDEGFAQGIERAANAANARTEGGWDVRATAEYREGWVDAADRCESDIRALVREPAKE